MSFLFLLENICCGYSLEVPRRGASNEYPQQMISWRNKKDISIFRMEKNALSVAMLNPLWTEWTLPHYILEDSNFKYVRLCDLDIPKEKWLLYLQTVETQISGCILRGLIWVCTFCQLPF